MKDKCSTIAIWFWLATAGTLHGQGTFQNLDFELAVVPNVPADQFGSDVPVAVGLPGWTVYIGGVINETILHNNLSLGAPAVSILGPSWDQNILQGQYTALLQPSFPGFAVQPAIGQTGMIPLNTKSVTYVCKLFYTSAYVTFQGQPLSGAILGGSFSSGLMFGADLTAFAGQTGELRFIGGGYLDNIQFSDQPIPEPSAFSLFGLGALLLSRHFQRKG